MYYNSTGVLNVINDDFWNFEEDDTTALDTTSCFVYPYYEGPVVYKILKINNKKIAYRIKDNTIYYLKKNENGTQLIERVANDIQELIDLAK